MKVHELLFLKAGGKLNALALASACKETAWLVLQLKDQELFD